MVAKNSPALADQAESLRLTSGPFATVYDDFAESLHLGLGDRDVDDLDELAAKAAADLDQASRRRLHFCESIKGALPDSTDADASEALLDGLIALDARESSDYMRLVVVAQEMARRLARSGAAPAAAKKGGRQQGGKAGDFLGHIAYLAAAAHGVINEILHSGEDDATRRGELCVAAEQVVSEIGWVADKGVEVLGGGAQHRGGADAWLLPPCLRGGTDRASA